MESLIRDMQTKDLNEFVEKEFGVNLFENPSRNITFKQRRT